MTCIENMIKCAEMFWVNKWIMDKLCLNNKITKSEDTTIPKRTDNSI